MVNVSEKEFIRLQKQSQAYDRMKPVYEKLKEALNLVQQWRNDPEMFMEEIAPTIIAALSHAEQLEKEVKL